jgi:DNA-binding MarR family transcriptional regulator
VPAPPDIPAGWESVLAPDTEPASLLVTLWLSRLGRLLEVALESVVRQRGLAASEFRVLATLLLTGPPHQMSPTRLNDIVVVTSGGMTKAVTRLVELGLVERRPDPTDGRAQLVRLTDGGRRTAAELVDDLVAEVRRRTDALGPDGRRRVAAMLGDLLGVFDDGRPRPGDPSSPVSRRASRR